MRYFPNRLALPLAPQASDFDSVIRHERNRLEFARKFAPQFVRCLEQNIQELEQEQAAITQRSQPK